LGNVRKPNTALQSHGLSEQCFDVLRATVDAKQIKLGVLSVSKRRLLREWLHLLPGGNEVRRFWHRVGGRDDL